VIFFIGASLLCYLFLYRPRSIKAMKGTRETASLERKLEEKNQELNKIRKEIEANKEGGTRDYFNRYQIPPKERETTFLEILDELANRLDVKTEKVKPEPTQETPEYIRYSFLVETKSKYEEIAKFVDSLENSLGLNVDDLNIRNDPKDPLLHRLKFTVSTFELQETEPSPPPETPDQQGPSIHVDVRDDIVLKRDPFLEKEEKKKIIAARKPKERPRRLPRLELNGIIKIGRTKVAIINGEDVREGDWVTARKGKRTARYRILEIRENEVIADYKGEKYTFKLEPLVQTKKP